MPAPLLTDTCACVKTVLQPERHLSRRVRDMIFKRLPDMGMRLESAHFRTCLATWLAQEPFDVVHIEGIEMAPYLDVVKAAPSRPLVIFDDHNCEYVLQQRAFLTDLQLPTRWPVAAYSLVQWLRLRRYESWACRRADRVLAVSEDDAVALRKLVPGLEVAVVPNGIDTRAYSPAIADSQLPIAGLQSSTHSLVFTGTMDFRPNVDAVLWFARQVLPRVRQVVPEAHFVVVGQRPHRRLDRLRKQLAVTLTGWVEDARPYIAQATVYVAPLRMGGGTRLKLLEAMAMGKPVVVTRLGAEGYPVKHKRELLLADAPAEFAAAVANLLKAPERRAALGRTARAFVEQHYDWRAIVPRVERVYER